MLPDLSSLRMQVSYLTTAPQIMRHIGVGDVHVQL